MLLAAEVPIRHLSAALSSVLLNVGGVAPFIQSLTIT